MFLIWRSLYCERRFCLTRCITILLNTFRTINHIMGKNCDYSNNWLDSKLKMYMSMCVCVQENLQSELIYFCFTRLDVEKKMRFSHVNHDSELPRPIEGMHVNVFYICVHTRGLLMHDAYTRCNGDLHRRKVNVYSGCG